MINKLNMLSVKKSALIVFIGLVFAFSLNAHSVQAQESPESIALSPTSQKYAIDAGQSKNNSFSIINQGQTAYDFIVYSRPYSVKDETYEPDFKATPPGSDAYSWVQFKQTQYHLEPGKMATVEYTLNVPKIATPGGHYGVIFAETKPSDDKLKTQSVVRNKRVGMLIYATVNGDNKLAGEAMSSDIPFWQVKPPLRASVTAKNTGNTDFTDETRVVVRDIFGNVKYDATKEFTLLPQTTRRMNLDYEGASWLGLYKVSTSQKILDKSTASEGYVLILPRYIPIALLVILLLGGFYAWFRRRKN